MHAVLFLLLLLVFVALLALLWWRFKGSGKPKEVVQVATTNHKSLRSYHYGPAPLPPVMAPSVAAPPLATNSPLAMLMPEEDFRAKEEQDLQAEADRQEAAQMEQREREQVLVVVAAADKVAAETPVPAVPAIAAPPASIAASVLDMLGIADQLSSVTAAVADDDSDDDSVAEALYDNPLTTATLTKNDVANRRATVELRQRRRAALTAKSSDQKATLATLLAR